LALLVSLAAAVTIPNPVIPYGEKTHEVKVGAPLVILLLLLFSVAIRSFVGFAGCYECPKLKTLLYGMPLAAFTGKALGGWISDRLGWKKTAVGALLISAPVIAFGNQVPEAMLAGMMLFQMTMPVTLVAAVRLLPNQPAFAFGLTCLALSAGALPTFFGLVKRLTDHYLIFVLIGVSAAALYLALRLFRDTIPMKYSRRD